MDSGGWYTRKRKASSSSDGATTNGDNDVSAIAAAKKLSNESTNNSNIPKSLLPFLGWTKLSACKLQQRRKKRRIDTTWSADEGLQKVTGRAVFFIHDPRPGEAENDKDESKIWFQGRFFPSIGGGGTARSSTKKSISPTSVSDVVTPNNFRMDNSWGLLATQNEIIDECLCCEDGGYRELDITFIQQKKMQSSSSYARSNNVGSSNNKKKVRWVSQDVVWTGGNMMMLSTDPFTSTSTISTDEPGVKFDTQKLMEGEKAIEVATKYFPSMVKRLQIHNVTNDNDDESTDKMMDDAMILIGDMEVVAPVGFVNCNNRRVGFAHRLGSRDDSSDDDGLWND